MSGNIRHEGAIVRAHYPDSGDINGRAPRHRVIIVQVSGAQREIVTLQVHNGVRWESGTCVGRWPEGLVRRDIPARDRINYLREKFGAMVCVGPADFRILDQLYRDALSAITGGNCVNQD